MLREHACCSLPVSPLSLSHSFKPSSCSQPTYRPIAFSAWENVGSVASGAPASLPIATRGARSLAPPPTSAVVGHIIHLGLGGREGPPRRGMALQWSAPGPRDVIRDAKGRREGGRVLSPLPAVRFAVALLRPRPEEDLMRRQPACQPQPALGMADENVG